MESAPGANTRREPPPIPPNYVSLRQLQELRLKEKEEQERRRREEEEAEKAAAAARREAEKAAAARREAEKAAAARREAEKAAAARREAEKAAVAAAIKREAALKAETNDRAFSWEASGGAKERHRGGQEHQWVAMAHRAPATTPRPLARGQGAAEKRGAAIGGGRGDKGPDDVVDSAPHGGGKGRRKGKGKGKLAELAPPSSPGGKPGNKIESKAKGKVPGDQAEESSSSGGPGDPAEAAILSSRDRYRRRKPTGVGGRSAETCAGIAPVKTAGQSPPRGVRLDDMGKPKPPAPRRADAVVGSGSPEGKKAAPAQAPPTSAADGSSKSTGGGELPKTTEAKPGGLVEGQRRRQMIEVQAVDELNPQVARCSAGRWRGRSNEAAEQHGRVWVPKAAAGSSAGAGL